MEITETKKVEDLNKNLIQFEYRKLILCLKPSEFVLDVKLTVTFCKALAYTRKNIVVFGLLLF